MRDSAFEISSAYRTVGKYFKQQILGQSSYQSLVEQFNFLKFCIIFKIQIFSISYLSDKCVMCRSKCRRK